METEKVKLKVLILEDVPSDAELSKAYLQMLDFEFEFELTQKKSEFTNLLTEFKPDIILSDFNLPTFDGLKALEIAKSTVPNTPFIFVTGTLGEEVAVEAIRSGATDFIVKNRIENLPPAVVRALREAKETESKIEAHNEADKLEKRFKALIENSLEGVLLVDRGYQILYASPVSKRILGYDPSELVGQNITKLFFKDDHQSVAIINGEPQIYVNNFSTKNNGKIWLETTITDQRNIDGVNALVVNYRDVSEKVTAQQNLEDTLENLEAMVKERTVDLQKAHEQLETTYEKLEEAYAETKDSINYAQRIQQAVLPSEDELKEVFTTAFVIYKPKDVVSGDFYWIYKRDDIVFFAVVDCTGHGVPGALMSMAGNELLDNIIIERHIERPDTILEELDKSIIRLLNRKNAHTALNDGMDLSLCVIDYKKMTMSFAGAHNPCIFFSKNQCKVLKANRHAIGGRYNGAKEFSRQLIPFEKGDKLYLFSDGFQDQFGGPDNKKLLKKRFCEHIKSSHKLSHEEQKRFLEQTFIDWKGDNFQVDDVTVIGVEL